MGRATERRIRIENDTVERVARQLELDGRIEALDPEGRAVCISQDARGWVLCWGAEPGWLGEPTFLARMLVSVVGVENALSPDALAAS